MSNTPNIPLSLPKGWSTVEGGAVRVQLGGAAGNADERRAGTTPAALCQLAFDTDVIPPATGTSWTCQCGGDIGIKVGERVVAHAFVFGPAPMLCVHVYDIVHGGEPALLNLAEALTYMQQLAALYVQEH